MDHKKFSRSLRGPSPPLTGRWNRLSLFVHSRLWTSARRRSAIKTMGSSVSRQYADPPRVRTSLGWVEGKWVEINEYNAAKAFLGIPFAKPPIGELRFEKPQPPDPWTGILECRKYRSRSVQTSFVWDFVDVRVPISEDCLYLNIITPSKQTTEFPKGYAVMVYIHGGGYVMDSAAKYHYTKCAKYLVKNNVIVVTIQYRLGLLGYFCLDDEYIRGNFGFWDQIMALKFIKENISKFGGDPERITVFGQSAGGAATDLLSVSPVSRDLFQRKICMAGSAENNWAVTDRAKAIEYSREKAIALGFRPQNNWDDIDNKKCLDFLRKQPSQKFGLTMVGERAVLNEMRLLLAPVYDDELLPRPVCELRKETKPKDSISGLCAHEGLLFLLLSRRFPNRKLLELFESNVIKMLERHNHLLPESQKIYPADFKALYGVDEDMKRDKKKVQDACLAMMDDFINNTPVYNYSKNMVDQGGKCYLYLFEHYNPALFHGFNLFMPFTAATHCTELAYLFDVNILLKPWKRSKEDIKVRNLITTMWTNFAKYGNPNSVRFDFNWAPATKESLGKHLVIKEKPEMRLEYDFEERVKKLSPSFMAYNKELYSASCL
ncbi:unnamed protein product [Bursaphelenchus xylophilus]|uniref:Carboxylic ester hydrolase n=1 Tax=Bursaphelenchus xylophilus TaxID=6326 RepID=A0A1I7RTD1_BURXY|nr:unnamed protein product [Bursaphelenchus xylophilus]CAG9122497.1 unnamed protein product [Bursaphelenchus xylophilus]